MFASAIVPENYSNSPKASESTASDSGDFCGVKVCCCKQVERLPMLFHEVAKLNFEHFLDDNADINERVYSFMERVDDKSWDLFQKTLEEHFQGGRTLTPLKLMYGNSGIPERSIIARDIKSLCNPTFIYYLHDDESQIPEAKRNADKGYSVDIIYEDEHFLSVNKPSGLLTVPHKVDSTHATSLPRVGLVHRLDLGTTGACIVAKNLAAYSYFKLSKIVVNPRPIGRGYKTGTRGAFRLRVCR